MEQAPTTGIAALVPPCPGPFPPAFYTIAVSGLLAITTGPGALSRHDRDGVPSCGSVQPHAPADGLVWTLVCCCVFSFFPNRVSGSALGRT